MKKIFYFMAVGTLLLSLTGCKDDPIGSIAVSSEKPGKVTDIDIENTPGGAIISYALPKQTDISYVLAEYNYKGTMVNNKSSVYNNFVTIEGFGTTDPVNVKLYTVSHSEIMSEPVTVTINPLVPPVYSIADSFEWTSDYGGFALSWKNNTSSEVIITMLKYDHQEAKYLEEETIYSEAEDGSYTFRGMKDEPSQFGLCVRDKYYNISDTVKFELTPVFETKLPTKYFARVTNISADNHSQLGGWNFEYLWDGVTSTDAGWHTSDWNNQKRPCYITIDLGQEAQLSRFKLYHRMALVYSHCNPKDFEVWASDGYTEVAEEEYWEKGGGWQTSGEWEWLGDFTTPKPSGEGNDVTNEDYTLALNGFEFEIPKGKKQLRYIRIGFKKQWSGELNVHFAEIEFFGNNKFPENEGLFDEQ